MCGDGVGAGGGCNRRRTQCTWGPLGSAALDSTWALIQCPQQTTVAWAPEPRPDTALTEYTQQSTGSGRLGHSRKVGLPLCPRAWAALAAFHCPTCSSGLTAVSSNPADNCVCSVMTRTCTLLRDTAQLTAPQLLYGLQSD